MITSEFLLHARLDHLTLEAWIEAGWLLPQVEGDETRFGEVELARVQLIRDLKEDRGVNDEGVAVILDLIDQIHGVRQTFRSVLAAVWAQPEPTRRQILAHAREAAARFDEAPERSRNSGMEQE